MSKQVWTRQLRIYLVLATSYFGLYALLLTLVPSWAARLGGSSFDAGVLLAVLPATGLVGDSIVGRAATRFGARAVILFALVSTVVGALVLFAATNYGTLILATAILGVSLSLMMTPILGGLSSHAGENQIRAQSTNAGWQRAGGLFAALFLLNVLSPSGQYLVLAATVLLIATLVVTALLLPPGKPVPRPQPANAHQRPPREQSLIRLVKSSRFLQGGLIINVATPLLVIMGSSFFPLVLLDMMRPDLLTACLAARELMAIACAYAIRNVSKRAKLDKLWATTVAVGVCGLFALSFVDSAILIVLLFSLHGAAISSGIVLNNVRIYDGSTASNRLYGYAANGMVMRGASLVLPLVLGMSLNVSTAFTFGMTALISAGIAFTYLVLVRAGTNR